MGQMLTAAIAWRYLKSKKSHSAVGAISAVSVCGMAVATAAIIIVLSVFNGFKEAIADRLDMLTPDVIAMPAKGKVFSGTDEILSRVRAVKGVATATPTLSDNALAICDAREMPVTLKGVIPGEYSRVASIRPLIEKDGRYFADSAAGAAAAKEAVIAIGTASQINALPRGSILLFAPRRQGRINPANPATSFITDSVTVAGVYRSDQQEYDANGVIVDLAVARALLQYEDEASAIEIKAAPGTDDTVLARRVADALGDRFVVKDRLMQQEMNFRMVSIEKWVSFLLLFFILTIASFNIISTLSMLVLEKQKSMGTLTALGMSRRRTSGVFAWESFYVSAIGGISGILLGLFLCWLQQEFGLIKIPGDPSAGILTAYPVRIIWTDVLVTLVPIAVIGAATALIASRFARSRIIL